MLEHLSLVGMFRSMIIIVLRLGLKILEWLKSPPTMVENVSTRSIAFISGSGTFPLHSDQGHTFWSIVPTSPSFRFNRRSYSRTFVLSSTISTGTIIHTNHYAIIFIIINYYFLLLSNGNRIAAPQHSSHDMIAAFPSFQFRHVLNLPTIIPRSMMNWRGS